MNNSLFLTLPERLLQLNAMPFRLNGKWVVYRMQASVRLIDNLAFSEACRLSSETGKPLKVVFHLDPDFPDANYRHFLFLADGLREVARQLSERNIPFELLAGDFAQTIGAVAADAVCVITDRGYLRHQRRQLLQLAATVPCALIAVEDNLIVPVESASHKAEWGARTLRPKLSAKYSYFSARSRFRVPDPVTLPGSALTADTQLLDRVLQEVRIRRYESPVDMRGGEEEALRLLADFTAEKLADYDTARNHPELQATSRLSPYLHFGMISPLTICEAVASRPESVPFVEQLFVRRELAFNFIYYTSGYDTYDALPVWARNTLRHHASDPRPFVYSPSELVRAATHDPCWNAAMRQMVTTGFMENTMRMYWGKKIIEWSRTPEEAFATILSLNNRYFLDGRDANSYAGVGWCFGLHDRPWQERPVFGMVRYMNENGLRRKYDMDKYISLF